MTAGTDPTTVLGDAARAAASNARFHAGKLRKATSLAGPADHLLAAGSIAAAVETLAGTLHVMARIAGDGYPHAAQNMAAAAGMAAAAMPHLSRAVTRLSQHETDVSSPPLPVFRYATLLRADAHDLLATARRSYTPDADIGLAGDITGTLWALSGALKNIAFRTGEGDAAAELFAGTFLIDAALAPAADAQTRLELAGFPPGDLGYLAVLGAPALAGPSSHSLPDEARIAGHVRYQQAVALYRTGQPPRDARDRGWHAALAGSDLAELWHAARQSHFTEPDAPHGHDACPDGQCQFASAQPPRGTAGAQFARRLASAERARHAMDAEHTKGCAAARYCRWEDRNLPQSERAARSLERRAARPARLPASAQGRPRRPDSQPARTTARAL